MKYKKLDVINRNWSVKYLISLSTNERVLIFEEINEYLQSLKAEDRIIWALQHLSGQSVLSSSFGIHSSVSLHLITCHYPNIPIILIDTGYLFPETYCFVDRLSEQMKLNLHVFCPNMSAAWQEARYGKLWEQGIKGIQRYNFMNKVEPMLCALKKLKVNIWFAGLRRTQSNSRKNLPIVTIHKGVFKFLPIVDWSNQQMHAYIIKHALEYHPLWKQGYVSVGDIHTTSKWSPGKKEEETRFFGLQRECGLHFVDQ